MELIEIENDSALEPRGLQGDPLTTFSPSLLSIAVTAVDQGGVPALAFQDEDSEDPANSPNEVTSDQSGRALQFGRYMGQITSRIERAWIRPRTAIGAPLFSCRARIQQDERGNVREVMLEQCSGELIWQLSVVRAIESASPLPAPPDPSVFSKSIVISLESDAFKPGGNSDGFEPEIGSRSTGSHEPNSSAWGK